MIVTTDIWGIMCLIQFCAKYLIFHICTGRLKLFQQNSVATYLLDKPVHSIRKNSCIQMIHCYWYMYYYVHMESVFCIRQYLNITRHNITFTNLQEQNIFHNHIIFVKIFKIYFNHHQVLRTSFTTNLQTQNASACSNTIRKPTSRLSRVSIFIKTFIDVY